jgi:hypothetical protein
VPTEEELRKKEQQKAEMAARFREAMNRKKEEKKLLMNKELEDLMDLDKKFALYPQEAKMDLERFELSSQNELQRKIKGLRAKLGLSGYDEDEEEKNALLEIEDFMLNPEQLKKKKMVIQMRNMQAQRAKAREEKRLKNEEKERVRTENPEKYKEELYERRKILLEKYKKIKFQKKELASRSSNQREKRVHALAQTETDKFVVKFQNSLLNWA